MGDRINMLIDSAKGEIGKILLEEATPVVVGEMLAGTALEALTEAAGVAIPGVGNMMLSYKQKKMEYNFELYVSKIVEKQDDINKRLEKLEDQKRIAIQHKYFGLIADYASQAKQEEKIDFIVNGFVNIAGDVIDQEDTVLMYYDTLDQLTLLELRVLRVYTSSMYFSNGNVETIPDIMSSCDLDYSQMNMIKEKLARLGLLESKNDADMDENMRNVMKYLEEVTKGKKNPKLKNLKKISKSESYKLTSYGRKLYLFFSEIAKEVED